MIWSSSLRKAICCRASRPRARRPVCRSPPSSLARRAHDVFPGRACPGEERLVEFRFSRHLAGGTDADAALPDRDEQIGETLVTAATRLRAAESENPVGELRERRPDLLPVDDPFLAVRCALEARPSSHVGEIRARVRFTVALAPELLARAIGGRNRCFCASVPKASSVGPTSSMPRCPSRAGARARAYSSAKITCSASVALRRRRFRASRCSSSARDRGAAPILAAVPCGGMRAVAAQVPERTREFGVEPGGGLGAESLFYWRKS